MRQPRFLLIRKAGGATAYTLPAGSGTYSLTGTASDLLAARSLTAATDSYSVSGTDATLTYSSLTAYDLTAGSGSYSISGTAAELIHCDNVNVLTYSEAFDNAYWADDANTPGLTSGQSDPLGGTNAYIADDNSATAVSALKINAVTTTSSEYWTLSVFLKKDASPTAYPAILWGQATNYRGIVVDPTDGSFVNVSFTSSGTTGSVESYDANFWRVSVSGVSDFTSQGVWIYPAYNEDGSDTSAANSKGSNVFFGAQFEQCIAATTYKSTESTAYSLTSDSGSYSVSGTAAELLADRTLAADTTSYALTGTAVALNYGRILQATTAGYSLTGTASALLAARNLAAGTDSYSISGTDVTLTYSALTAYNLTADTGSYSITGTAVDLLTARSLLAGTEAYSVSGTAAGLTYTPLGAYNLTCDSGSYSVSGNATTFTKTSQLAANSSNYSIAGTDLGLSYGYTLEATAGSYSLSGTAASLIATRLLSADTDSYIFSGTAAGLTYSAAPIEPTPECRTLVVQSEARTVTVEAEILDAYVIDPDTGYSLVDPGTGAYLISSYIMNRRLLVAAENRTVNAEIAC